MATTLLIIKMRYFEIFLLVFWVTTLYCVELVVAANNIENTNLQFTQDNNDNNNHQQHQSIERKSAGNKNDENHNDKTTERVLDKPNEPVLSEKQMYEYANLPISYPIKFAKNEPDSNKEKDANAAANNQAEPDNNNIIDESLISADGTTVSADKDHAQVTEFISHLIQKRLKWVKKLEQEFDGLDEMFLEEDEPVQILQPWEIELEELYESAMKIINKSRTDKTAGYEILIDAANRGHAKSNAQIAWAHLFGNPLELNIDKAKKTFSELAESGLPEAHMGLGFMYATGIGFNVSQARALVHYTMAAAGGDPWAQMVLGYRYWAGVTVPSSCETALEFYRKVATSVASQITFSGGAAIHRIRLLDEVENSGLSANIVNNDVIEYYQLLADKGDVQTQVGLGQLHYQGGHGIPVDHQRALHYFLPAANAGNAVAMAFLGKIYLEGSEHIKADNETAFKYFLKAAELGNPVGQSGLGLMYLHGKGVSKDTEKAYNYFTQAAEQGWVDGQLQLGNMYFSKFIFVHSSYITLKCFLCRWNWCKKRF